MQLNQRLIALADCWAAASNRSVARLATIVANDGQVFDRLRAGKNCTTETADKFFAFFRDADNWPDSVLRVEALALLDDVDLGVVHEDADTAPAAGSSAGNEGGNSRQAVADA